MINFYDLLEQVEEGQAHNPFAAKTTDGKWIEGTVSIDFLNANFGQRATVAEMKAATESEGLSRFFDYLAEQDKIPA